MKRKKLVAASSFKVGQGYRVVLPVGAYYTWQGTKLEGVGILPDTAEQLTAECLAVGMDTQLDKALAALS